MKDTKFWRIVGVVVCVGLFYVGHGLHNRGGDPLPSLTNVAHAGGVAALNGMLYTTSQDGLTVHTWVVDPSTAKPRYMRELRATASEGGRDDRPAQKP
jgi:hypothetical protein